MPDKPRLQIAKVLRVVNEGGRYATLYIDGEPFTYATVDGFHVSSMAQNPKMPGVTLTIAASRVEFVDDLDRPGATLPPDGPASPPGSTPLAQQDDTAATRPACRAKPAGGAVYGMGDPRNPCGKADTCTQSPQCDGWWSPDMGCRPRWLRRRTG